METHKYLVNLHAYLSVCMLENKILVPIFIFLTNLNVITKLYILILTELCKNIHSISITFLGWTWQNICQGISAKSNQANPELFTHFLQLMNFYFLRKQSLISWEMLRITITVTFPTYRVTPCHFVSINFICIVLQWLSGWEVWAVRLELFAFL